MAQARNAVSQRPSRDTPAGPVGESDPNVVDPAIDPIAGPRDSEASQSHRDPPNYGKVKETKSGPGTFTLVAAIAVILAGAYYFFWQKAPPANETNAPQVTQPVQPTQ